MAGAQRATLHIARSGMLDTICLEATFARRQGLYSTAIH